MVKGQSEERFGGMFDESLRERLGERFVIWVCKWLGDWLIDSFGER